MTDKQFVNTQMPRAMVKWIDTKRAEMTLDTGRVISRGDIIRECIERMGFTPSDIMRAAEVDRLERESELKALPGAQLGSMVASGELGKLKGAA